MTLVFVQNFKHFQNFAFQVVKSANGKNGHSAPLHVEKERDTETGNNSSNEKYFDTYHLKKLFMCVQGNQHLDYYWFGLSRDLMKLSSTNR